MPTKRSLFLGILAVVVIAAALFAIVRSTRRPVATTQTWFYDLNTKQLFAAPLSAVPPIAAPSGPQPDGSLAGVRAAVFGCGSCTAAHRFIAYLELFTPEARARLDAGHKVDPTETVLSTFDDTGILVRRPDDTAWVERQTPEGQQVLGSVGAHPCPPGVFPQQCRPGQ